MRSSVAIAASLAGATGLLAGQTASAMAWGLWQGDDGRPGHYAEQLLPPLHLSPLSAPPGHARDGQAEEGQAVVQGVVKPSMGPPAQKSGSDPYQTRPWSEPDNKSSSLLCIQLDQVAKRSEAHKARTRVWAQMGRTVTRNATRQVPSATHAR